MYKDAHLLEVGLTYVLALALPAHGLLPCLLS